MNRGLQRLFQSLASSLNRSQWCLLGHRVFRHSSHDSFTQMPQTMQCSKWVGSYGWVEVRYRGIGMGKVVESKATSPFSAWIPVQLFHILVYSTTLVPVSYKNKLIDLLLFYLKLWNSNTLTHTYRHIYTYICPGTKNSIVEILAWFVCRQAYIKIEK